MVTRPKDASVAEGQRLRSLSGQQSFPLPRVCGPSSGSLAGLRSLADHAFGMFSGERAETGKEFFQVASDLPVEFVLDSVHFSQNWVGPHPSFSQ